MADTEYKNVSDMVRSITGNDELVDAVDEALEKHGLLRQLMAMRAVHDMSQDDIAATMGCSQSRIAKLESSSVNDVKYGELREYASAVRCELKAGLRPIDMTPATEVKCLASAINDRLSRMVELSHQDEEIAGGVARFLGETFLNMSLIIGRAGTLLSNNVDGTSRVDFRVELTRAKRDPESDCDDGFVEALTESDELAAS